MAKNQVTLTFAGDTKQLESAFDRVGQSSRQMSDNVGEAASGFDRVGEAADSSEAKAQGFSDTLTGTKDTMLGVSEIAKGNLFEGFVMAGQGMADLAGGAATFLVPALKSSVTWLGQTKVGMLAHAVATKVAAAAQWLWNVAMTANPIGIIIVAIAALIAIIVLIATKTTWFQDLWRVVWTFVKDTAVSFWEWLSGLPERIGGVFSSVARFVSAPFRAAFNFIADAWNNTIGRLSWSVPSWVPFIGGNTISVPRLNKFHAGGVVPGAPGTEMMALLQAGERVSPVGSGGNMVLEIRSSGNRVDDLIVELLSRAVKVRGGNVQRVLGG